MYDLSRFRRVAVTGMRDLVVSAASFDTNPRFRPLLRAAWGPLPWLTLWLVAVGAAVTGVWAAPYLEMVPFSTPTAWPVIFFSAVAASRLRSARASLGALTGGGFQAFRALSVPLILAGFIMVLTAELTWGMPSFDTGEGTFGLVAGVLRLVLSLLAHGAGVAVCTAVFTGSTNWFGSLFEIGWRFLVFSILLRVTFFVLDLVQGIFLKVIRSMVRSLIDLSWLDFLSPFVGDGLQFGVKSVVYLALIGGAWCAAERLFPDWVVDGEAELFPELERLLAPDFQDGDDDETETEDDSARAGNEDDATPSQPRARPASEPPPLPET
ncbi:MAG: hypothetical protein AAF533_30290 [Acidobacteriota bacterium]